MPFTDEELSEMKQFCHLSVIACPADDHEGAFDLVEPRRFEALLVRLAAAERVCKEAERVIGTGYHDLTRALLTDAWESWIKSKGEKGHP